MTLLRQRFGERLISKGAQVSWPPRSPHPDFFLCGYIKSKAYEPQPASIAELKDRIQEAIATITPEMRGKVLCGALPERCKECVRQRGGHLDNVVF